jgi:hypothetical protein
MGNLLQDLRHGAQMPYRDSDRLVMLSTNEDAANFYETVHGFDGSLRIDPCQSAAIRQIRVPVTLEERCKHFGKTCATARGCW